MKRTIAALLYLSLLISWATPARAGGGGDVTVIDFDSLPESTHVSDQFQPLGVVFAGNSFIDEFSGNPQFFPGASLPNYTTFGGLSPGPGSSLGCVIVLTADLVGPEIAEVGVMVFASASTPAPFQLIARDGLDNVVAMDEFEVTATFIGDLDVFTLRVSSPGMSSVELQAASGICAAIDNFELGTAILADGFESGDTLAWSSAVP